MRVGILSVRAAPVDRQRIGQPLRAGQLPGEAQGRLPPPGRDSLNHAIIARTTRRWLVVVCIGLAWVTGAGREVFAQTPPGVGRDVCDRTYQVRAAIVTASGAVTCAHITLRHMREITSLDLSYQGISSLSVGDLDGLVRLDTLDLPGVTAPARRAQGAPSLHAARPGDAARQRGGRSTLLTIAAVWCSAC